MMAATVYDPLTGRILRTMRLRDLEEVELNCAADEAWIEGLADVQTQRVVDGALVPRDPAEMEAEAIAAAWVEFRRERSRRLFTSDWTQVPDAPVDQTQWAYYRQQLRDLPDNTVDPRYPEWPVPPT